MWIMNEDGKMRVSRLSVINEDLEISKMMMLFGRGRQSLVNFFFIFEQIN